MITTITIKKETKEKLDSLKICSDESYNSLLLRLIKGVENVPEKS